MPKPTRVAVPIEEEEEEEKPLNAAWENHCCLLEDYAKHTIVLQALFDLHMLQLQVSSLSQNMIQ